MIMELTQKVDMLEVNLKKDISLLSEQINTKFKNKFTTENTSKSLSFPRSMSTPFKLENNSNDYLCRK